MRHAVDVSESLKRIPEDQVGGSALVESADTDTQVLRSLKKYDGVGRLSISNINEGIRPVIRALDNDLEDSESSDLASVKSQSI